MRKSTLVYITGAIAAIGLLGAGAANAAFVVAVANDTSVLHPNFSFGGDTTAASFSATSAAVGLGAHQSIFGGDGVALPDTYVVSYTPGTDVDNYSPATGALLGSSTGFGTELASGLAGGTTGLYNVYISVPEATNVNVAGSTVTATGDFISAVAGPGLNLNNGGTGPDLDPGLAFVGGAVNAWYKVGAVQLTAGTTYTLTMEAGENSFVSQRLAGVMWEQVPEPASAVLLGLGSLALFGRRRR